jgi:CubicO group peptidase (beta-lactamase class C family)
VSALAEVLEDAILRTRATPCAAALVLAPGVHERVVVGKLRYDDDAQPARASTPFDLASLTKLLCTTLVVARAVEAGRLSLDDAPWPRWPGATIRHVLAHTAGVPAWRPYFEEANTERVTGLPAGRDLVVTRARGTPLEAAPGTRTLYSDVGMIALGAHLEERLDAPLDVLFREAERATWGETALRFVRLGDEGFHPKVPLVAPTERCPWRRRVVHGQVHDDNAFAMGGVAGHAGLFGSLDDVERAGRYLLDAIVGRDDGVAAILRTFAFVDGARGLGFDRATPGGSTGDALSSSSVGHLGFTGTSLWIDPEREALFVLLTNRVHETRDNDGIKPLRQRFHRAAARLVDDALEQLTDR